MSEERKKTNHLDVLSLCHSSRCCPSLSFGPWSLHAPFRFRNVCHKQKGFRRRKSAGYNHVLLKITELRNCSWSMFLQQDNYPKENAADRPHVWPYSDFRPFLVSGSTKHIITEPEPGKETRGRPLNERSNPAEGYNSAIACHLAANKTCSRRYKVGDFSVLTRARTKNHLNVLEAVYISVLNPVLCKQKSFVTSLTLFQRTQRTHPP